MPAIKITFVDGNIEMVTFSHTKDRDDVYNDAVFELRKERNDYVCPYK